MDRSPTETEQVSTSSIQIQRVKAVGAAEYKKSTYGTLSNEEYDKIANEFNVCSGRSLRRYVEKAKTDNEIEILEQAPRPGRATEIETEPLQKQFLESLASRKYHVALRSVEARLKE